MDATLRRKFQKVAAELHDAFPQQLARVVFITSFTREKPIYVSPEIAGKLTTDIAAIKEAVKHHRDYMHEHSAGAVSVRNYNWGGKIVDLIAWESSTVVPGITFSAEFTSEMRAFYFFEHEMGHILLRNGSSSIRGVSQNMAESACDAFAMLRHIQRYGKNTGYVERRSAELATNFIFYGDKKHYSSETLQKVIDLDEKYIRSLSAQETAELASKIADNCQIDEDVLDDIYNAFKVPREMNQEYMAGKRKPRFAGQADMKVSMEVLSVIKKHETDPYIFRAGKRFLNTSKFMVEKARTDPNWQHVLNYINRHDPEARPGTQRSFSLWRR